MGVRFRKNVNFGPFRINFSKSGIGASFGVKGYFRMAYCIDTEKVERSLEALRRFVKENY